MNPAKRDAEMRGADPSKIILLEKIIIAWAMVATLAYCVQKVTANYTFDYGFLSQPKYEDRLKGLEAALTDIGKAYYMTDAGGPTEAEAREQDRLTRYLLAPYLTVNADAPYRVKDFHHPADVRGWAEDHHLDLIRDFKNGVALFKQKDRP